MFCVECGKTLGEQNKFCAHCGTPRVVDAGATKPAPVTQQAKQDPLSDSPVTPEQVVDSPAASAPTATTPSEPEIVALFNAARAGNAGAQYELGLMYDNGDNGQGVPQDYAQAAAWYRLAAEQGDATAQSRLDRIPRHHSPSSVEVAPNQIRVEDAADRYTREPSKAAPKPRTGEQRSVGGAADRYTKDPSPDAADVRTHNRMALAGFCLGLASILLSELGIVPLAAIVCSGIGLGTFNADTQKRKWMAGWGLGLGIVYTLLLPLRALLQ